MVNYWLLSYPRQNMEITIKKKLIGGASDTRSKNRFKYDLAIGDKLVLYILGDYVIKGSAIISGDYFLDNSIVWPPRKYEVWPHRREIELEKVYDEGEEKDIHDYYSKLDILEEARQQNRVLGKAFGNFVRGLTPKQISEHDYRLLTGKIKTTEKNYFILRTGGERYEDIPSKQYHFKEGIPGSRQFLNAANSGEFVYFNKDRGGFWAEGMIGDINEETRKGESHYFANIEYFNPIGPIKLEEVIGQLSFHSIPQYGIFKISKDDFNIIVYFSRRLNTFIRSLTVSDFRGIRKTKKKINFTDFSILIGRNNSGKTSILEALSLFPLPKSVNPSDQIPVIEEFRLNFLSKLHSNYNSLLYGYTGEAKINYSLKNMEAELFLKDIKDAFQLSWNNSKLDLNTTHNEELLYDFFQKFGSEYNNSGGMVLYIPNNQDHYKIIRENLTKEKWKNIILKEGKHVKIIRNLINEWVDDNFTELLFAPDLQVRKEFEDKTSLYIKLNDLGLGVQKVVIIALYLDLFEPKLILIDDIEASIHPSLLRAFMKWLANRKCQIIITTHSIDVLSYLIELDINNSSIIEVYKEDRDVLKSHTHSIEEFKAIFDANIDIRKIIGEKKLGL
jgi:AAA15 family ATPase/GTPase